MCVSRKGGTGCNVGDRRSMDRTEEGGKEGRKMRGRGFVRQFGVSLSCNVLISHDLDNTIPHTHTLSDNEGSE